jgi:hypothetical protein
MAVRLWIVSGVLAATVFAGCGGSSHKGANSTTASTSSSAQLPPGAPPALRGVQGRVLAVGELSGFTRQEPRQLGINADSWVAEEKLPASQATRERARLRGLGFVAAVRETLQHPASGSPAEGLSIVERFRSPPAARTELAFQLRQPKGLGAREFAVPAIPGARGFGGSSPESSGLNVAFTKGPFYYLVGAGWPTRSPSPPTRAIVIAAAVHLYDRVQP